MRCVQRNPISRFFFFFFHLFAVVDSFVLNMTLLRSTIIVAFLALRSFQNNVKIYCNRNATWNFMGKNNASVTHNFKNILCSVECICWARCGANLANTCKHTSECETTEYGTLNTQFVYLSCLKCDVTQPPFGSILHKY